MPKRRVLPYGPAVLHGLVSFATGPLYTPKSEKRWARRLASALIIELSSGPDSAEAGAPESHRSCIATFPRRHWISFVQHPVLRQAFDREEAVRWSRSALGRVPRFAQRRVILFFWPMRASSANQISIVSMPTAFSRATASRRPGSFF
jgi:hypothetical protein